MTTMPMKTGRALAIWAFCVGVVAFLIGLIPFIGIVAGLSAIALGVLALTKRQTMWMAIVAIILGTLAAATSAVTTANVDAIIAAGRDAQSVDSAASPTPSASLSPSPKEGKASASAPSKPQTQQTITPSASTSPPAASTSPTSNPTPKATPTATATPTPTGIPRDYECGSKPTISTRQFLCDIDFGADWPLTVQDGFVYCEVGFEGPLYPVTFEAPDGTTYAVNGTAKGLTDLPEIDEIWADSPTLSGTKINIEPIISAGLALCGS